MALERWAARVVLVLGLSVLLATSDDDDDDDDWVMRSSRVRLESQGAGDDKVVRIAIRVSSDLLNESREPLTIDLMGDADRPISDVSLRWLNADDSLTLRDAGAQVMLDAGLSRPTILLDATTGDASWDDGDLFPDAGGTAGPDAGGRYAGLPSDATFMRAYLAFWSRRIVTVQPGTLTAPDGFFEVELEALIAAQVATPYSIDFTATVSHGYHEDFDPTELAISAEVRDAP